MLAFLFALPVLLVVKVSRCHSRSSFPILLKAAGHSLLLEDCSSVEVRIVDSSPKNHGLQNILCCGNVVLFVEVVRHLMAQSPSLLDCSVRGVTVASDERDEGHRGGLGDHSGHLGRQTHQIEGWPMVCQLRAPHIDPRDAQANDGE